MSFEEWVEIIGKGVDLAGITVIVAGAILSTIDFLSRYRSDVDLKLAYRRYRTGLGRAILLGLELLVAADIIRTVAIAPTFESVGVLALIVLIRTFLSTALEVELEGRWPWEPRNEDRAAQRRTTAKASSSEETRQGLE